MMPPRPYPTGTRDCLTTQVRDRRRFTSPTEHMQIENSVKGGMLLLGLVLLQSVLSVSVEV